MRRSESREHIFRLVFCGDFHSGEELDGQAEAYFIDLSTAMADEQLPNPQECPREITEEERAFIVEKFHDIRSRIPQIDSQIDAVAQGWKTSRMGKAELAILRLAVYEIFYDDSVPEKVAINEAVELAKKFGGEDSPSFVNGILARMVRDGEAGPESAEPARAAAARKRRAQMEAKRQKAVRIEAAARQRKARLAEQAEPKDLS